MPKISALINYCNDLGFLKLLASGDQFELYDEILVVDGPYAYVKDHPFLGVDVTYLDEDPWGKTFLSHPNVKYLKQIWRDEEEKRVAAYAACENDLIFLHDTDEFYAFDSNAINTFVDSKKGVGFFRCQNLCLDGHYAASRLVQHEADFPLKAFAFKRQLVSAESHLDYLWLVGVKQNKPVQGLLDLNPLAKGYHFTQMRDLPGQTQKFAFYTSLYASTLADPSKSSPIFEIIKNKLANGAFSREDAQGIYLRGNPGFTGMMKHEEGFLVQKRIVFSESLEAILQTVNAMRYRFQTGSRFNFINGWPCYIVVTENVEVIRVVSEYAEQFTLQYSDIIFDKLFEPMKTVIPRIAGEFVLPPSGTATAVRLIQITYRSGREMQEVDSHVSAQVW